MTARAPPSKGLEEDRDLLEAFRRGERAALTEVYRRYVAVVAHALRAGVRVTVEGRPTVVREALAESDVEALVQETFLRAFAEGARQRYDGLRAYSGYITTIARNQLIDRARRRSHEVLTADVGDQVAEEHLWADTLVEDQEVRAVVESVRAGLTPREQGVFRARYDEGMTLREAAQALSIPLITVRRVDVALRRRLLEALRAAGYLLHVEVGIPGGTRDRSKG
jgi:RNA polymerase sigma factor (sigma-70 family)